MKKIELILSWMLSVFLIFIGIMVITHSVIPGLLVLIGGIIALPLTNNFLKSHNIKLNSWIGMFIAVVLFIVGIIFIDDGQEVYNGNINNTPENDNYSEPNDEPKVLTKSEEMIVKLYELIEEKVVFDSGDYVKGEVPSGEYAFIPFGNRGYYSEEDSAGNIIDNENFSSFGYVKVHEVGDLSTRGVLVSVNSFEKLGVKGAKELYEIVNETSDYYESGFYKVGVDIEPGNYIVESFGSAYYSILTGPVGDNEIVKNDRFNGKATITLKNGQYLELSRAKIIQ